MYDVTTMTGLNRAAAARACGRRQHPFVVWPEDLRLWQGLALLRRLSVVDLPFPVLSSAERPGYEARGWAVDSEGGLDDFAAELRSGDRCFFTSPERREVACQRRVAVVAAAGGEREPECRELSVR